MNTAPHHQQGQQQQQQYYGGIPDGQAPATQYADPGSYNATHAAGTAAAAGALAGGTGGEDSRSHEERMLRWYSMKLWMRLGSSIFELILIGLTAAICANPQKYGVGRYWDYYLYYNIAPLCFASIALIWDIIDAAILWKKRQHTRIAFVALHIAIEAALWGGGGIVSVLFSAIVVTNFGPIGLPVVVFSGLLLVIRLLYMILAAIETHRLNRENQINRLVERLQQRQQQLGGQNISPAAIASALGGSGGSAFDENKVLLDATARAGLSPAPAYQYPPQELDSAPRPPGELPNDSLYAYEMQGDRQFAVEMPPMSTAAQDQQGAPEPAAR